MSLYVLDSNFFIQAHRVTYPFDVAPSFWAKVRQLAHSGLVVSIDKVQDELFRQTDEEKKDELQLWCEANLPPTFFRDTSITVPEYTQVVMWAQSRSLQYRPAAIHEFLRAEVADAWLVAYALNDVNDRIIVTNEVSQPNAKTKVKIPEACDGCGARFTNPIEMFRRLGERF